MDLAHKTIYCQLVARVLLADEAVTDAEHAFLERLMDRLGLTEEQKTDVVEGVDPSADVGAQLRALPMAEREAVLLELRNAALADDDFGDKERELIEAVERSIGG